MQLARPPGYTLVELLVVIAIVIVLFGIIVSVLSQARQRAFAAEDISWMRQIGQAAELYSQENAAAP